MADANMQNFDKRMDAILRKHSQLAKGYTPRMTKDGLIVAQPARRLRLPWRSLLVILMLVMGFKVYLHATIGAEAYAETVAGLSAGSQVEQAGAWIMQADPLTVAASAQMAAFLD